LASTSVSLTLVARLLSAVRELPGVLFGAAPGQVACRRITRDLRALLNGCNQWRFATLNFFM